MVTYACICNLTHVTLTCLRIGNVPPVGGDKPFISHSQTQEWGGDLFPPTSVAVVSPPPPCGRDIPPILLPPTLEVVLALAFGFSHMSRCPLTSGPKLALDLALKLDLDLAQIGRGVAECRGLAECQGVPECREVADCRGVAECRGVVECRAVAECRGVAESRGSVFAHLR